MTIRYERETSAAKTLTGGGHYVRFPAGVYELSLDDDERERAVADAYDRVEYVDDDGSSDTEWSDTDESDTDDSDTDESDADESASEEAAAEYVEENEESDTDVESEESDTDEPAESEDE